MPTSQVDITTKNIDESTSQQNTTVTGALAFFRGTTVHAVDTIPDPSSSIKKTNVYDFLVSSVADAATGTVTSASPVANTFATGTATLVSVIATDTVTINGLIYLAVSGTASEGEFDIDGDDNANAIELRNAINADTRSGTTGDLTATASTNVVTATTDVSGTAGNAITLTSSLTHVSVAVVIQSADFPHGNLLFVGGFAKCVRAEVHRMVELGRKVWVFNLVLLRPPFR